MAIIDLVGEAQRLTVSWRTSVLGRIGNARIKVLRMDASSHAEEMHDYDEGLLVLEGRLELLVDGQHRAVNAGEMLIVKAQQAHAVLAGSHGTLLIIDPAPAG